MVKEEYVRKHYTEGENRNPKKPSKKEVITNKRELGEKKKK